MSRIALNLQAVRERILAVQQQSDTYAQASTKELRLIAVSKTFSAIEVIEAMKAGQMDFGENYVQEAVEKMGEVVKLASLELSGSSNRFSSDTALAVSKCQTSRVTSPAKPELQFRPPVWHFIGPIQSNKTRTIAEHFDWVHSVDRLKIAQRLAEQRPPHLKPLKVLIQVNISKETSKSGVEPHEVEELARNITKLPRLEFCGLMAIPESADNLDQQRRPFAALHQLAKQLKANGLPCTELSMGMSADLEAAIMEGATMIRVGSAIFGFRTVTQS